MFTTPRNRLASFGALYPRKLLLVLVLLLAVAAVLSGSSMRTARAASAQNASPPGPLQGTGPWLENGRLIATWEEYPGGMLLVFDPGWVKQFYAGSCSFSATAVCYKWIQYFYFNTDPYNTEFWSPFQRGCMVLGADPVSVGEADGVGVITDTAADANTYIPVNRPLELDSAQNPGGGGTAPAPSADVLPSPWTYNQCFGGAAGTGGGRISGTWDANIGVWVISQSGNSVFGTIAFNDANGGGNGTFTGTLSGDTVPYTYQTAEGNYGHGQLSFSADGCSMQGSMIRETNGGWTGSVSGTKRGC